MARAKASPLTVKLKTAAEMCDMHPDTMGRLVAREVFTAIRANGRGPGRRVFLHADEVAVYATTRDELAVRDLRVRKGRVKP